MLFTGKTGGPVYETNLSQPARSGRHRNLRRQTPAELTAEARNCEFEGADGLAVDLGDLKPEFRKRDALKGVIDAVRLPFMFCFYRNDPQQHLGDDARQEVLLAAADAGASIIDVMGDLYDPSPMELTRNQAAVDKQKRLIDRIHGKGADVVISSHMQCPRTGGNRCSNTCRKPRSAARMR